MEVPQKKGIMYVYKLATGNKTPANDLPEKAKKAAPRGIWRLRKPKTYRENDQTVGIEGRKSFVSKIEEQGKKDCNVKVFEERKSFTLEIDGQGEPKNNNKIFEGRKSCASIEGQEGKDGHYKIFEKRKSSASYIERQGGLDGNYKIFEGRKLSTSNMESQGGQDGNLKIFEGRKSSASNIEGRGGQDGNLKIFKGRSSFASNIEGRERQDGNFKILEGRKSCTLNIERQGGKDGKYKIFEGRKSCASNIEGKDGNYKILEGRKSVSHVEASDWSVVAKFLQVKVVVSDMPGFMQVHAFRCATKTYDSSENFSSKHMAYTMKKEFDKVYGPAWHCIVGSSFGSFVTHSTGSFLYFSIHDIYILIFKTKVQRTLD